ncbi:MAG: hypothetical protein ACRYGM_09795 [Janthinobacterium lividum]
MSAALSGTVRAAPPGVPRRFGPLLALVGVTLALGSAGVPAARPLFILGCAAVAADLLRFGPAAHYAGCLALFCLAPLLRRVVDVHAGYDASGLMISGPLLAILTPLPLLLKALAGDNRLDPLLRPFILGLACAFYAALLTVLNGNFVQAIGGGLKWVAPALYGMWIVLELRRAPGSAASLIETAARTLMLLIPLLGLYGFVQYIDPPNWDRYWMSYTSIASIGQPEPFMVRVFSTMNAPAGYATFTATGLLLFGFRRAGPLLLLAAGPSVLGLLLSQYRTAWIALAIGILLGLFHPLARRRATMLLVTLPLLGAGVIAFTPAGEMLGARLQTLGAISEDGSGQERLAEYGRLLSDDSGALLGHGFDSTDVMQAGAQALDGMLVVACYAMGLVGGILCVASVVWAAVLGIRGAWASGGLNGLAIAAVLIGMVAQLPLAVVSASEVGFLFWSLVAIGGSLPWRRAMRSPR